MTHIFTRKHPRILALPTQLQIVIKIQKIGKNFVKSQEKFMSFQEFFSAQNEAEIILSRIGQIKGTFKCQTKEFENPTKLNSSYESHATRWYFFWCGRRQVHMFDLLRKCVFGALYFSPKFLITCQIVILVRFQMIQISIFGAYSLILLVFEIV